MVSIFLLGQTAVFAFCPACPPHESSNNADFNSVGQSQQKIGIVQSYFRGARTILTVGIDPNKSS